MNEIIQQIKAHARQAQIQPQFAKDQAWEIEQLAEALQAENALKIPREPTQAMLKAGHLAWSEGTLTLAIWQAMYDAALQETSDGQ
jgi:hypothetical protein